MMDTSNLPISGGVLLTVLIVALVSFFITGPLLGERSIARSDWQSQCVTSLSEEVRQEAPAPAYVPELGCKTFMGFFGQKGQAFCDMHGGQIDNNPLFDSLNRVQEEKDRLNRLRLERAVSSTADRCVCASSLMLEEQRLSWAIYAGTARLVTPGKIKNLQGELVQALRSPLCAMEG